MDAAREATSHKEQRRAEEEEDEEDEEERKEADEDEREEEVWIENNVDWAAADVVILFVFMFVTMFLDDRITRYSMARRRMKERQANEGEAQGEPRKHEKVKMKTRRVDEI